MFFASFLIVSITPFINKLNSSRDLTICIISSTSSFEIIDVAIPDPKTYLCTPASTADAATINPNGIKTLLANGVSTFFINGKLVFSNGPRSLPRNPPDCTILGS